MKEDIIDTAVPWMTGSSGGVRRCGCEIHVYSERCLDILHIPSADTLPGITTRYLSPSLQLASAIL